MKEGGRILKPVAIDTGGTMTDAVIMDTEGEFTVGKAVTTPRDESEGILNGMRSACGYWGLDSEEVIKDIDISIYSGTVSVHTRR